MTKGIVYYTDNKGDPAVLPVVRKNLKRVGNGLKIVSVSLEPIEDFGENIVLKRQRSYLTMCKQQLAGLEKIDSDIVFFAEHDVLYPKCHFDFTPARPDVYYYNTNWWRVRRSDGQAFTFHAVAQFGLCAYRSLLIEHFTARINRVEKNGGLLSLGIGYEPGLSKPPVGIDNHELQTWRSAHPCIDIRHDSNFSNGDLGSTFVDGQIPDGVWADEVPYWGKTTGVFDSFLKNIDKVCDLNISMIP